MGKYMRKGKGVGKMELSQGTLVGVRTRAKSLALQQEQTIGNISLLHQSFPATATTVTSEKIGGSSSHGLSAQPLYMELRSRKLERGRRSGKDKIMEKTLNVPELCKDSSSRIFLPLSTELRSFDKKRCRLWLHAGSCSLQGSESTSHNRLTSGSRHLCPPVGPSDSSNHSVGQSNICISQKRSFGILTRNRRQELADSSTSNSETAVGLEATLALQNSADSLNKGHAEVEICFGESPIGADACNAARECQPSTTKRMRACTPDSFIRGIEAPGSTSKARPALQSSPLPSTVFVDCSDAPDVSEIEAFLSSAEQRERRRFINRFNFDPLLERPLRGRYEWFSM